MPRKLRTNTFEVKVAPRRASRRRDAKCGRYITQVGTVGYALGTWTHEEHTRIRKRDETEELIEGKVSEECVVFAETAVNVLGELKKPGLVIEMRKMLGG